MTNDRSTAPALGSSSLLALAGLALLFSGASSLVLEIVWTRRLDLVIGNTVQAAATAASVFMFGLGGGAWLSGRRLHKIKSPWKAYCLLEIGVAAWALLSLGLLPFLQKTAPPLARMLSSSEVETVPLFLRLLIAAILLVPPTLLMGATLPILVKGTGIPKEDIDGKGSLLYGLNTIGACLGAYLAGFLFIPTLGLRGATIVAALLGIGACLFGAIGWISTRAHFATSDSEKEEPSTGEDTVSIPWLPLLVAALTGFLAMWLQVLWFRSLALVTGTSVYSITTVLVVVLASIGLGPLLLAWPMRKLGRIQKWLPLGILLTLAGLAVFAAILHFGGAPRRSLEALRPGMDWATLTRGQFKTAILLILPTGLLLAPILPLAARIAADRSASPGKAVARTLVANTLGALLGGLLCGFFFLPMLGIQHGYQVAGLLLALTGIAACAWGLKGSPRFFVTSTLAVVTVLMALFSWKPWDRMAFALGAWFAPGVHADGKNWYQIMQTSRLLHYEEGRGATSAVLQGHDGHLRYLSDGKVEAGTDVRGMINQRLAGHLPLLFHPGDPKETLNIGLGAGTTAGALAAHPGPDRITVLELEPTSVPAAEAFALSNGNVLADPRVEVIFGDARNHLFTTKRRYDVLSSDPFEPVVAGAMQLFTTEHHQLVRERLAEDGVVSQWIPMYEMSPDDYRDLLTTFLDTFPNSLFFSTGTDSILIGFAGDKRASFEQVAKRFEEPSVRASFAGIGFDRIEQVLGLMVADFAELPGGEKWMEMGEVLHDDHPRVEFSAPRNVFGGELRRNRQIQIGLFEKSIEYSTEPPKVINERTAVLEATRAGWLLGEGEQETALEAARNAMAISPLHPLVREECGEVFRTLGLVSLARADQMKGQIAEAQAQGKTELVRTLTTEQTALTAQAHLRLTAARNARPFHFKTIHRLAMLELNRGNLAGAVNIVADGRKKFPRSPYIEMVHAALEAMQKRYPQSADACEEAIRRAPRLQAAWDQYKQITESSGSPEMQARYRAFLGGP